MPFFNPASEELRYLNSHERTIIKLTVFGAFFTCFDFVIYFFFKDAILESLFSPTVSKEMQAFSFLVLVLVGYVSRPLGGQILADIGDRHGRKPVLLFSLFLVALSTLCIGVLPSYAQIGIFAPLLLMALRFAQGLGMGAEVPASWSYLAEHMPGRQIGAVCGTLIAVQILSVLLANIMSSLLANSLTPNQMMSYGWRIPFILGGVFTLFAIIMRYRLSETPIFLYAQAKNQLIPRLPLLHAFHHHRYGLTMTFGLSWFVSSVFLIVYLLMPAFSIQMFEIDINWIMIANGIGLLFASLGALMYGYLADRFNSGKVFSIGCITLALATLLFYTIIKNTHELLMLGYAILGFCSGIIGIVPSMCVRLLPANVRMSGMAFSYNVAYAITGAITPILLLNFSSNISSIPVLYLVFLCILGVIMGLFLTNLHGLYRIEEKPHHTEMV
ncbi:MULTISPECIES: MFS transporter [unclassified Moraxella]|uniref:MFS transporter n=1 Tax=unclassified Moraxella TaxID=2685852 RepID=UPI003AF67ED6